MKDHISDLIQQALDTLTEQAVITIDSQPAIKIDTSRDKDHGDFATNIALVLAKQAGLPPRQLAEQLLKALPEADYIAKTEIAGPGFINFFLHPGAYQQIITDVLNHKEAFGRSDVGQGQRVQVEFVSANPTGPLHVGHGRGAAYGATVADLLAAVGFDVHREYYVNDAGRQMDILATSVWLRYLELCGEELAFPANGYKGDYVWDIAATLHRSRGDDWRHTAEDVFTNVPADETQGGDKEAHIDGLIRRARELLGDAAYEMIFDLGLNTILDDIRKDLQDLGVVYQQWFSERSLTRSGAVEKIIERLQASGHVYEKHGALWFKSTDFGDEKDRVVVRENGQATYFASDIAYHAEKLERGYDRVIDVWGADHHGYVPRVKAALQALGDDVTKLEVLLVQFAILYRSGKKAQMSTRSGEFVTLRELRHEVGNDATRFFYVMRKCEQHMDFDLDLAKSKSNENPVYYIQYAHARVCSVLRQAEQKQMDHNPERGQQNLSLLTEDHENDLMTLLTRFPETVKQAALRFEPHLLAHYLRELANALHTYYNAHVFLVDDEKLRDARMNLIVATRQVLANGLQLLGVSAPESM